MVAHPDDEVLGCGGTIAKHIATGDEVVVISLSRCEREHEFNLAFGALGPGKACGTAWLADQRFEAEPFTDLVTIVEQWRDDETPDLIYTHWPSDLNLDHALTARAVLTAFRPCASRASILAFETISSTEWGAEPFDPNWFVELTPDQLAAKDRALACYPSELRDPPHPRNHVGVYTHAEYRGMQAGCRYAEAFKVIRHHA